MKDMSEEKREPITFDTGDYAKLFRFTIFGKKFFIMWGIEK